MKTKILILFALLANAICSIAQDERLCVDYDFSPQAFRMITEGNANPDLNTGTLHLDVPVYTWSDPDFTVPFSLSYSTNGFVPARLAGPVGLGWSMNVGGCITRQIYGKCDFNDFVENDNLIGRRYLTDYDEEDIYMMGNDIIYDSASSSSQAQIMTDGNKCYETQADVFNFNFFGHSGSFVFNTSDGVTVFDTNGAAGTYRIEGSDIMGFSIITDDGYEYCFGTSGSSKARLYDINPIYYMAGGIAVPGISGRQPVTTWYLDKVVAPNGRQLILTYTQNGTGSLIPPDEATVATTFAQGAYKVPNSAGGHFEVYKHASMTTMPYLSEIWLKESDSYVEQGINIARFEYSSKMYKETEDDDDPLYKSLVTLQKKLDSIDICGHEGQPVAGAAFSYSYKNSRMLLDSMRVRNVGVYAFDYNDDRFMPGILSDAIDYWGYYNGRLNNDDTDINPMSMNQYYDEVPENDEMRFKDPDYSYSMTGTLSSVIYPTGGKTTFEYEANTADRILLRNHLTLNPDGSMRDPFIPFLGYYQEFMGIGECGGVRIKSITDHYDDNDSFTRSFSYNIPGTDESSGIVLKFKRYATFTINGNMTYNNHCSFPDNSLDRSHVAYSYVTEHFPDGSYTVHNFTDYKDYPDEYSGYNKLGENPSWYDTYQKNLMKNIFREPDSRDYRRGKLKKTEYYDSSDALKQEVEYEYEDSGDDYTAYVVESGGHLWSARRFLCDFKLKRQIETRHESGRSVRTVKTLTYNQQGQLVQESVTDGSGLNGDIVYLRYCHEVPLKEAPEELYGILSDRLHVKLRNGFRYLTSSTEYIYRDSDKNANPVCKIEYLIDTPQSVSPNLNVTGLCAIARNGATSLTTYVYDSLYRLVGAEFPGGAYISYTWDENGNYIISKSVNDPNQSYGYEWRDMVGPMRIFSPDGSWQRYGYDGSQRLETIYDHLDNPITRYGYFIKNQ